MVERVEVKPGLTLDDAGNARVVWLPRQSWFIEAGRFGIELNGRLIRETEPLEHRDHVHVGNADGWRVFVIDGGAPLESVKRIGNWLALDHARVSPQAARYHVVHVDDPGKSGVLVAGGRLRSADARCVDLFSVGGVAHAVFDVPRGVLVFHVVARARSSGQPPLHALLARVLREARALPDRVGLGLDDIVLTWDGAVVIRPAARGRTRGPAQSSLVDDILALVTRRLDDGDEAERTLSAAGALDDTGSRDLVRALMAEEWAEEQRLREELSTLDARGVEWLIARGASSA